MVFFTAVFNHLNTVEIHGMHLDSCSGGLHLPDAAGAYPCLPALALGQT